MTSTNCRVRTLFGRQWATLPQIVVFDVDFTLWPYWCDCHTSPKYTRSVDGKVVDGRGQQLVLFDEVPAVMAELRSASIDIALASRTGEPAWLQCIAKLMRFDVDGSEMSLWDCATYHEIYPGDKLRHFRAIAEKSGVACSSMLFFDDEQRNANVCQLGVTFVNADGGVDVNMLVRGLEKYAASSGDST